MSQTAVQRLSVRHDGANSLRSARRRRAFLYGIVGASAVSVIVVLAFEFQTYIRMTYTEIQCLRLLESIHSTEDARLVRTRLTACGDRWRRLRGEIGTRSFLVGTDYFRDEYSRIARIDGALEEVGDCFPFAELDTLNFQQAIFGITVIWFVLDEFHAQYGKYPSELAELSRSIDGSPAFLDSSKLIDPWGRPYQYDQNGVRNQGLSPDVWSLGPPHNRSRTATIGNWW
jgi:hypothetical protein